MTNQRQIAMTGSHHNASTFAGLIYFFYSRYPVRSSAVVAGTIIGTLLEGIGVALLFPIISIAVNGAPENLPGPFLYVLDALQSWGIGTSIGILIVLAAGAMIAKSVTTGLINYYVGYSHVIITGDLRLQAIRAMQSCQWLTFREQPQGVLINLVGAELERAAACFNLLQKLIAGILAFAAYLVLSTTLSAELLVAAAILCGCAIVILKPLITMSLNAGSLETESQRELSQELSDVFGVMKPLRAMGMLGQFQKIITRLNAHLVTARRRLVISSSALIFAQEAIVIVTASAGFYFSLQVLELPLSEVGFLGILILRISGRFAAIQKARQGLANSQPALVKHLETVRAMRDNAEQRTGATMPGEKNRIEFRDVSFSYEDRLILDNVSFTIEQGDLAVFSGPSGAGKTTILDLLCGFYLPTSGKINIGETDITEIDVIAWRRRLGYVPQEPILINDNIRRNVALYESGVNDDDVLDALKSANVASVVERLKDRMDTQIHHAGTLLSGGERQRITLARALYKKTGILLLDEPTASLDKASELIFYETLEKLKGRVTIIVVTHHDAIEQIADKIFHLDAGTITETGVQNRVAS